MILRLHHAQIAVPEGAEEDAQQFYCGVLGLPEVEKPDALAARASFWLAVGDWQVHVGTEAGVDRAATKAHLAYEVQDVEDWRQTLGAQGIKILESVPIPGFDRFEFRDPFGNRVELISESAEAAK